MSTFLKSTKGKIIIACAALALIIAVAVVLVVLLIPKEEYRTIVIAELDGSAFVSNDKKQNTPAYVGMALFDGDTVSVDEGAKLTVELDGDKYMLAEGGTKFKLEATGKAGSDKTVIHLESGTALTRIKNKLNDDQSYVVKTPTSTISVRGTVFFISIETEGDTTSVSHGVLDGKVTVAAIEDDGSVSQAEIILDAEQAAIVSMLAGENAHFIVDDNGNAITEIDYSSLSDAIIEKLIEFIEDGEELAVDIDSLKDILDNAEQEHTHAFGEWTPDPNDATKHTRTCECGEKESGIHSGTPACELCGYIPPNTPVSVSVSVSPTDDCGYLLSVNGAPHEGNYSGTVPVGSVFTVVAAPNEGYRFIGWRDMTSGAILSHSAAYECTVAGEISLAAVFDIDDYALFGVDGQRFGSTDFYNATVALAKPDSSSTVYILRDEIYEGFTSGFELPFLKSHNGSYGRDVYDITWDLNAHTIKYAALAPTLASGTTWRIIASNGGAMITDGQGLVYYEAAKYAGQIIITGGMFDFDPTAYVPEGYTVKMIKAPEFIPLSSADPDNEPAAEYAKLLEQYGSYAAIINSHMLDGGYKIRNTEGVGLWVVLPDGEDTSACTHSGGICAIQFDGELMDEYCTLCGTKLEHIHRDIAWEWNGDGHIGYCGICGVSLSEEMETHTFTSTFNGTNEHGEATATRYCTVCGFEDQTVAHTGGQATADELAICDICGEPYGDYDHTGEQ